MAKLTDEHREFIITRLAMYDTPSMVQRAVRETFGFTIERNQIDTYDPLSYRARTGHLAKRWKILFEDVRAKFKASVAEIPIADATYRLRRLQAMHEAAFDKGNYAQAAELLEQAAKEAGGLFSSLREVKVTGKIQTEELSTADKRDALAARMAEALAAAATAPTTH